MDEYFEHLRNWPQVSLTDLHRYVNIDLGMGLVPSGHMPLPELIWHHMASLAHNEFDGLVHKRRNSIANALELCLSCTNPSSYYCYIIVLSGALWLIYSYSTWLPLWI